MKIRGAIFDLDGTLLDSMFIWETIGEDYLRSLGIEPGEELNEKLKNMSLYQAACYYKREYGVSGTLEEIMAGVNKSIEHFYIDQVLPKKGAPEFLARLKSEGVKMCVATATDKHLVQAALKRTGLLNYFGEIFTCTSVGCGKDEPRIYDKSLDFLGTLKSETIVFEDALYAIKTAKNAGYIVCAVYDKFAQEQKEIKALADYYLKDFTETEVIIK
ncbi:MAG: HAD family phosphatase [Clostridia bacterium]|jgi:HAD superfamily hydrolase (TIGR01509 family)|nr:HAD family phosphatase [Clostridia bacterium]